MRVPLLLLGLLVPLLLLLAPARATAQGPPKEARYLMSFEVEGRSTWKRPPHNGMTDCYHRHFDSGEGEETLSLKTRRPARVLFWEGADRRASMVVGTWDLLKPAATDGQKLGGTWFRKRRDRSWWTAGDCGGTGGERKIGEDADCGTRLPSWLVHVGWARDGEVHPQIGADPAVPDRELEDFDRCDAEYAAPLSVEALTLRGQRLASDVVRRRPRVITLGDRRSATGTAPAGARPSSVRTSVSWKLTFQLVDRNGEPVPERKPRRRGGSRRRGRG